MNKLEALVKLKEDYEAKLKEDGKDAIKEAFAGFFESNPNVDSIRWTQYTPYFNDGEACVFSVHDFRVKTNDGSFSDSDGDYEDGYVGSWELGQSGLSNNLDNLQGAVGDIEDAMETVFGDHVQVTCFRDRVDVEEYSHD